MKTASEMNNDIVKITTIIEEKYPELSKYLVEIPVKISGSNNLDISNKNLNDYYESLDALLQNYTLNHTIATK